MKFTKMHGTGQDYVIVDCFAERTPRNPHGLALEVSDRQRGIGAQGLILVEPSETANAQMQIYNGLGEKTHTCIHGLRCVAKYLFDRKLVPHDRLSIESMGRTHHVDVFSNSAVAQFLRVDMGSPTLDAAKIPTLLPGDRDHGNCVANAMLDLGGNALRVTCVTIKTPHCVVFVEQISDELVTQLGPILEYAEAFPEQTSVQFAQVESPGNVRVRTWKRGEGDVPASVEGACAVAVAGVISGRTERKISAQLPGGLLEVEWEEQSNHVFATGSAVEVFSGNWNGLS